VVTTYQSAPIRSSTTVARSSGTPGFGTILAAAQICADGATRQSWFVYWPARPARPWSPNPIASSMAGVWPPQPPTGAGVVGPEPDGIVVDVEPAGAVVVVVLDEVVVLDRRGLLSRPESPSSHALSPSVTIPASRTMANGERDKDTSGVLPSMAHASTNAVTLPG
jgi:hypothetical protein